MLYRHTINATAVFEETVPDSYEILIADVSIETKTTRFVLVYRAPNCSAISSCRLRKAISDHCA